MAPHEFTEIEKRSRLTFALNNLDNNFQNVVFVDESSCWGKLKFRINFLKNQFFSKKNFFIFIKLNKLTLKSVEANFVSKCFIVI